MTSKQDAPRIKTASGRTIALKNLRPGDWLLHNSGVKSVVLQNWPSLARFEDVVYGGVTKTSWEYAGVCLPSHRWTYIGRGRKRKWLKYVPAFLRSYFSHYSKP